MVNVCRICGDTKRLNADGVCRYRGGCEHRMLTHQAEVYRLTAEMAVLDPLPCGHTQQDHADQFQAMFEAARRHPSNGPDTE